MDMGHMTLLGGAGWMLPSLEQVDREYNLVPTFCLSFGAGDCVTLS